MQHDRTEVPLVIAGDPEGAKLLPEQVMEIHRQHAEGVGWKRIAEHAGTTRSNVSRIITGKRWAHLHPQRRPDLYAARPVEPVEEVTQKPVLTVLSDDPLAETMQRIYTALSAEAA